MPRLASLLASAVVGLAAFLLFWIQPLVARLMLPSLGGNQAVWNASMVFFQAALLVGYAIAHLAGQDRRGMALTGVLAVGALLALPAGPPVATAPAAGWPPALWVVRHLALSIGIPVVVLAMASPLVQRWVAASGASPWSLYAWSNLGSLAALLAFPVLLEPRVTLSGQFMTWTVLVPAVIGLAAALRMVQAWRHQPVMGAERGEEMNNERPVAVSLAAPSSADTSVRSPGEVSWGVLGGWLIRSALASSLLLSVTAHVTTDIAAVPLLWIVPLSLYLLAFALAFMPGSEGRDPEPAARLGRLVVLPLVIWMGADPRAQGPAWVPLVVHLAVFFLVSRGLMGQLVATRPSPRRLTLFYLALAFGGLLGSAFNTFACPVIFNDIVEYPLGLILAVALLGGRTPASGRLALALDLALPAALGYLVIYLCDHVAFATREAMMIRGLVVVGGPGLLALFFFARPRRYALALVALVVAAGVYQDSLRVVLVRDRGPYGAFRVQSANNGVFHELIHGNTVHGRQAVDTPFCQVPLSYYHPTGPAGDLWTTLEVRDTTSPVAFVGLGVGTMAAYAGPGRLVDFYELDPRMMALAADTRWFRYLSDCRGTVRIIPGDARLSLASRPVIATPQRDSAPPTFGYGLIVLDAFSSDGIPIHLLTREAVALYLERLGPRGLLAFHISNRFLNLAPVIGNLAADARLMAVKRSDFQRENNYPGKLSSDWVVLARSPADIEPLLGDERWQVMVGAHAAPWTDDRADILSAFRW